MIVLGDKYKIDEDKYQFILYSSYEGEDKDGNPKTHWEPSYHPTYGQVAKAICDKEMKGVLVEDLQKSVEIFEQQIEKLTKAIEEVAK